MIDPQKDKGRQQSRFSNSLKNQNWKEKKIAADKVRWKEQTNNAQATIRGHFKMAYMRNRTLKILRLQDVWPVQL